MITSMWSFTDEETKDPEKSSNLPKVTQLGSEGMDSVNLLLEVKD